MIQIKNNNVYVLIEIFVGTWHCYCRYCQSRVEYMSM